MKYLLILLLTATLLVAQISPPYNNNGVGGSVVVDGTTCTIGSTCDPVQTLLTSYKGDFQNSVCAGTPYTITAVLANVVCGTTSPTITLPSAGTYLILFSARIDNLSATYAASRTLSVFLVRSNNGSGTIVQTFVLTGVQTISTQTAGSITSFALYSTLNNDDAITITSAIDVLPSAGSVVVSQARISAVRLA